MTEEEDSYNGESPPWMVLPLSTHEPDLSDDDEEE